MRAIIGGSGLDDANALGAAFQIQPQQIITPYGSVDLQQCQHGQACGYFLPRHAKGHQIAPHLINYAANIAALQQLGVRRAVAVYAVGAINPAYTTGQIIIPDQLIDYTWGRTPCFVGDELNHFDFSEPFCKDLSRQLEDIGTKLNLNIATGGTYGVTQGPRLETAAEIKRMAQDGCDLVGMTAMPEAALARAAHIALAGLCLVVNPAAGVGVPVSMDDLHTALAAGMQQVVKLLAAWMQS